MEPAIEPKLPVAKRVKKNEADTEQREDKDYRRAQQWKAEEAEDTKRNKRTRVVIIVTLVLCLLLPCALGTFFFVTCFTNFRLH